MRTNISNRFELFSTGQNREMISWAVNLNIMVVFILSAALVFIQFSGILTGLFELKYAYFYMILKALAVGWLWWQAQNEKGFWTASWLVNLFIDIIGINWSIIVFHSLTSSLIAAYIFYTMSITLFRGPIFGLLASIFSGAIHLASGLLLFYDKLPDAVLGSAKEAMEHLTLNNVITDSSLILVYTASSTAVAGYFLRKFYQTEVMAKESSRALDETQRRFGEVVDNIDLGVFRLDRNGGYLYYNKVYADIFGYSFEEMNFKSTKELVHPDELYASKSFLKTLYQGNPPNKPLIRKCIRKDGEVVYIEITTHKMELEGRNDFFFECTARDVTDRERLLRELKSSQHYLSRVFESITDGLITADSGRNIISFNQSAQEYFRYNAEEFSVIGLDDLFEDASQGKELTLKAGNESAFIQDVQLKRKDGSTFPADITLSAIRDHKLAIAGYVLVARDISEVKAETEKRRQLRMKLIQSDKLASIGQLAAGVAHELNNPLTGISFSAQVLLDKLERGISMTADRDKVVRILEGTDRIQKLARNLLSFSRAPSDEIPDLEQIHVSELIDECLVLTDYEIERCGVKIDKSVQEEMPFLFTSRNKLKQVLINLITNACHAMENSTEKQINIRASFKDEHILVEVQDTGEGIKEENLPKIFDPFFTTKEAGKGTGLGLSVCSNIISDMQGKLEAESELGVGTTFIITLPLKMKSKDLSEERKPEAG